METCERFQKKWSEKRGDHVETCERFHKKRGDHVET